MPNMCANFGGEKSLTAHNENVAYNHKRLAAA